MSVDEFSASSEAAAAQVSATRLARAETLAAEPPAVESGPVLTSACSKAADALRFIAVNTASLTAFWLYPVPHADHRRRRFCGAGAMWLVNFARLIAFGILLVPAWYHAARFYAFSMQLIKGVAYGPHRRNDMDLYLPSRYHIHECFVRPEKRVPVVVFFAGGAWMIGYKAWGALMGKVIMEEGLLFVTPDYRNFPQARVPEMVDDVDAALAWVFKNIAAYGGDPDNVYLCGQSAGAHLVSLTLLLQAQREAKFGPEKLGWTAGSLRACIAISGPYDVPNLMPHFNSRGLASSVMRTMFGEGDPDAEQRIKQRLELCGVTEETDAARRAVVRDLSPTCLLDDGRISAAAVALLPPVALMHGTGDQTVPHRSSERLAEALRNKGATVQLELFKGKSHTDPIIEDPLEGTASGLDPLLTSVLAVVDARLEAKGSGARPRGGQHRVTKALAPRALIRAAAWCNPF